MGTEIPATITKSGAAGEGVTTRCRPGAGHRDAGLPTAPRARVRTDAARGTVCARRAAPRFSAARSPGAVGLSLRRHRWRARLGSPAGGPGVAQARNLSRQSTMIERVQMSVKRVRACAAAPGCTPHRPAPRRTGSDGQVGVRWARSRIDGRWGPMPTPTRTVRRRPGPRPGTRTAATLPATVITTARLVTTPLPGRTPPDGKGAHRFSQRPAAAGPGSTSGPVA